MASVALLVSTCAAAPLQQPADPPPADDTLQVERPAAIDEALVFDLPVPSLKGLRKRKLWATYYYVPEVQHDPRGHELRDMEDVSLGAKLSRRDWCEAAMQGTVLVTLADGSRETINYAGIKKKDEVDCRPIYPRYPAISRSRYIAAVGPWGDGVEDMILLPHRSIAVDPKTIPFGSALYIPAARDLEVTLPDGSTAKHDGWFFAADRGGAIKKTHIDVFVGIGKHNPFASFVKSKRKATFEAYVVTDKRGGGAERLRKGHEALKP